MKIVQPVTWQQVENHWRTTEGWPMHSSRSDIIDPLPKETAWQLCEIEAHDIDRLFVISSDDWFGISAGTFRVSEVEQHLAPVGGGQPVGGIPAKILGQVSHLASGGSLPSGLVAVTDDAMLKGPFTLIEGNHRSVALLRARMLVGASTFVGLSPDIAKYWWARHTYR